MATPQEKLAESLKVLSDLQNNDGIAVVSPGSISRSHKDRLVENGFLQEVLRGWYISVKPGETPGSTSAWYPTFWYFISVYFNERFDDQWCLSPEQSIALHSGNFTVPTQLLVRSPKASNNSTKLLHNTSFFELKSKIPEKQDTTVLEMKLNLMSIPAALIACSSDYFVKSSIEARTVLLSIKDSSEILRRLLNGGHSKIAGRLVGAFRNVGRDKIANEVLTTMKKAGYDVREVDPFDSKITISGNSREVSPYVNRIKLMWYQMRQEVLEEFPKTKGIGNNFEDCIKNIDDAYNSDAYHSLSIEGFKVTPELIEKVKTGGWDPDHNKDDKDHKDALAARGYWQAFQEVKRSIKEIYAGKNPGSVIDNSYQTWYQELFAPSVIAGIITASDLAGFRSGQVIINGSMHTPPGPEAVRDAMPALIDLLIEEKEPSVRAVLGHFIFVFIHPYPDGNGRIARFLMNTQLISGGYPWTIISIEDRNEYMAALEKASTKNDISDFAKLIARKVNKKTK
jgi:Fic family protein